MSLWKEIGPEVDLGLIWSNNYSNESTNVSSSSESEENGTWSGLVLCVPVEDCRFSGEHTYDTGCHGQRKTKRQRDGRERTWGRRRELDLLLMVWSWTNYQGTMGLIFLIQTGFNQDSVYEVYRYSVRVWGETIRTSICIHFYHILFLNFYFVYVFNAHGSTIVKLCGRNSTKTTDLECYESEKHEVQKGVQIFTLPLTSYLTLEKFLIFLEPNFLCITRIIIAHTS